MTVAEAKIIGTEQIARACGCLCEFTLFEPDPFRAKRLTKFKLRRCQACGGKANFAHSLPSGADQFIGVEKIARACGCVCDFPLYEPDPNRDARRTKFTLGRCAVCGIPNSHKKIKKGSEIKSIPDGAVVTLKFNGAQWHGTLIAGDHTVEAETAGAMGILSKLARRWLQAAGRSMHGSVK